MAGSEASVIGEQVRALLRASTKATLATEMRDDAAPYASLVLVAWSHDCAPVFLLSDLADHTKNLQKSPRASLMIDGTDGLEDPLTGARVTLQGGIEKLDDEGLAARFIARHPSAALYRGFGDFNFYRMKSDRAHLVAGFGQIHWIDAADYLPSLGESFTLPDQEADVVAHMNEDHGDAVAYYASQILELDGVGWRLTGVDQDGADLARQGRHARLPFQKPANDAESARVELVRLVKQARRKANGETYGKANSA